MRSPLETKAHAGAHNIKEENIATESNPEACLALSEERRMAISKLFRAIAPLCSIYDTDCRNMAEEDIIAVSKDWNGRVDFVLADHL